MSAYTIAALMVCTAVPALASAAPVVATDRYTQAALAPRPDQQRPLDAVVNIAFAANIDTVGQAIDELLAGSGYTYQARDGIEEVLYHQPLPAVWQTFEQVTLHQALGLLGGDAWRVEVDPLRKAVSYALNDDYVDQRDLLVWEQRQGALSAADAGTDQHAGEYSLQLGAYRELDNATQLIAQLEANQLDGHLRRGNPFHLVFTHVGKNEHYLASVKAEVDQLLGVDSLIRHTPTLARTQRAQPPAPNAAPPVSGRPAVSPSFADPPAGPCRYVEIRVGSLKANIARNLSQCGYRMGAWRFGDSDHIADWIVQHPYQVTLDADGGVAALLTFIHRNYAIRGTVNQIDQTVDFEPAGRNQEAAP